MPPIIGIDFDNTIVCYNRVFRETAVRLGLLADTNGMDKVSIRDALRARPGGEMQWQKIQARVYGPGLESGQLFPGVTSFFRKARRQQISVYIVSHKTRFAGGNRSGADLHGAARLFMETQHFFQAGGLGLRPDRVFFEPSRSEKIHRIARLGCTHFIDDLPETFADEAFPDSIVKLLFDPTDRQFAAPGVRLFNNWKKMEAFFFA